MFLQLCMFKVSVVAEDSNVSTTMSVYSVGCGKIATERHNTAVMFYFHSNDNDSFRSLLKPNF